MAQQLEVPAAKTGNLSLVSGCAGVRMHTVFMLLITSLKPSYLHKPESGKGIAFPLHLNTL